MAASLALALGVWGCGGTSAPADGWIEAGTSLYALVEEADGVALLPPLGPDPGPSTSFDATLLERLTVELDALAPDGSSTPVAAFNAYSSPVLQRKDDFGVYFVNVPAARYLSVAANRTYRFRVLLDGRELARSDLSAQIFDALAKDPATLIGVKVHVDVRPAPSLTSISPATIAAGSEESTITLHGAGFMHDSTVLTGDHTLPSTWISSSALAVTLPAELLAPASLLALHVHTPAPGGGTSSDAILTVQSPAPMLGSLTPDSVLVGASDTPLTVIGGDFLAGATVRLDGVPLTTGWISSTMLIAVVPAHSLSAAGVHALGVDNPAPGQPAASTLAFTVTNPIPVLTHLTPTAATAGSAAQTIALDGASFLPGATVTFGGVAVTTTFVSATHLSALVPPVLLAGAGTFGVAVTNPTPSESSAPLTFTVENGQPAIASLSPAVTLVGSGDTLITITGSGFAPGADAFFDGSPMTTGWVSGTELVALAPAIDLAVAKTSAITVVNPTPSAGASGGATFTTANPQPNISALSTTSRAGTAGTLTVLGASFVSGSIVTLDGLALTTTFVSSSHVDAVIPATIAGGSHSVVVSNPAPSYGSSAPASFQLVNPQPSLTSMSPGSFTAGAASTTVTIDGSSFVDGVAALFDGTPLTTTRLSSTRLTALVPASLLATGRNVAVQALNPDPSNGVSGSLAVVVDNPVPTLSRVSPSPILGGGASATITLDGAGFVSGAAATVASADLGAAPVTTTFVSSTQLLGAIPASYLDSPRALTLSVTNPAPSTGASGSLGVSVVAPAITSITPSPATLVLPAGSLTLTIDGGNFTAQTMVQVTMNGVVQIVPATYVSATRITATTTGLTLGGTASVQVGWRRANGTYVWSNATATTVNTPVPSLTSSSPSLITAASGDTTVTVTGTSFTSGTQVFLDGTTVPVITWTPTQLTVVVSASLLANGRLANLTATNPQPTAGTSAALTLTIDNPVPAITALTPPRSLVNATVALTIDGAGFVPASVASFNGTALTTTYVSSTRLTVIVPGALTGVWNRYPVTVTSGAPAGGTSALRYFVVRPPTSNALTVSSGNRTTCALRTNGTVWCVGLNLNGQVGNNTITSPVVTPVQVSGITTAVQIGAGNGSFECARLADSTMRCWGANASGQLGNGTTTEAHTPVVVSGLSNVADFALGDLAGCARKTDGTVWCWGDNTYGQLGDGTTTRRTTPVQVSGITTAIGISAGYRNACALLDDGTVKCWGGSAGDGTTGATLTPVTLPGVSEAVMVKQHTFTTWIVLADGTLMGFGSSTVGQLFFSPGSSLTPIALSGLGSVLLFTGAEDSACATLRDGTTWCWGFNLHGQLGSSAVAVGSGSTTPVQVTLTNVSELSGGLQDIVVRRTDGTLRTWGSGISDQLGTGTTTDQPTPVTVTF